MPQRILHIAPYYLPDVAFGGPVFSVSSLCEALVKADIAVTVYTVSYNQPHQQPFRTMLNGVEVVYFKGNAGSPCQVSWQLWQELDRTCNQFDVVHLHTWWNILIFRSLRILHQKNVPVIISPRGMMSDYSFSHRKTLLKKAFQAQFGVNLLRKAWLHATSDAEAGDIGHRCGRDTDEIFVIPNLLNLLPAQNYQPVQGGYTLGFLSRLHHKKGIEVLLDAVANSPEITELVIGGRGDEAYEQLLRQKIKDLGIESKVRFAGWISNEQKAAFFSLFQVFVLPSFNENFANVVAEAWSFGKPVIVSTEVGLSDYVEQHNLGWICKPEKESLQMAIAIAAKGRQEWQAMGEAAIELVNERFTDDRIIDEYRLMYESVFEQAALLERGKTVSLAKNASDNFILGINAHHADASAAILKNGELIAAIEEERLRRVKHWAGFPSQAVKFCLQEAGIALDQVSTIAVGRDAKAKWAKKAQFMLSHPNAMGFALRGRLSNAEAAATVEARLNDMSLKSGGRKVDNKLVYVEHHRSHLASAFFGSDFKEAALLSVDGSGDFTTTMMGVGRDTKIEVLQSIDFPHSLGIFYTAFTQLLGFPYYGDEYKVMGLSPYGKPVYFEALKQVVNWSSNGTFSLVPDWFRPPEKGYISYDRQHRPVLPLLFTQKVEEVFGKARHSREPLTEHHHNLAASVQKMLEETVFHVLRHLHQTTGLTNLCLAGGVAQNSVANGKITRNTPFTNVYVPSAGHDAGLALGAALYVQHHVQGHSRQQGIFHAYSGSRFDNQEIEQLLEKKKFKHRFEISDDKLFETVADCIANGGVVGWFRGRSEFGPRALGNRSILADPRRADAKDLLNRKIKRRESFRPFAPSVLEEYAAEYFEYHETTPFMEKVFPVRKDKQQVIPAVTHVDGSGRLQTVCRKNNESFYRLIDTFRLKTGVPVLLNTSFNENEPIVNSPLEALECFERTSMDMLVIENFILTR